MKALITGASSGIGRDIALNLSNRGYDLILVSKSNKDIEKLTKKIKTKYTIISKDLSKREEVFDLYNKIKDEDIEILVNNAGFGIFGEFADTSLERELEMLDLNVGAVHILTKLFLNNFMKKNRGYILNVASAAAFQPGPLMASYYSTKAYVLRLTTSLYEELRVSNSKVVVSVLCPGPVDTNFNNTANVKFNLKSVSSKYVADYAMKKMFKKKLVIVPTFYIKTATFLSKFPPTKMLLKITYKIQSKKR